mmetsp:Transcript_30687/g.93934  ORF Transcript_30687/g.93934 Transcript_30687/m.93934 type:complete len:216 (-) Transcript_30687:2238-2885(-)
MLPCCSATSATCGCTLDVKAFHRQLLPYGGSCRTRAPSVVARGQARGWHSPHALPPAHALGVAQAHSSTSSRCPSAERFHSAPTAPRDGQGSNSVLCVASCGRNRLARMWTARLRQPMRRIWSSVMRVSCGCILPAKIYSLMSSSSWRRGAISVRTAASLLRVYTPWARRRVRGGVASSGTNKPMTGEEVNQKTASQPQRPCPRTTRTSATHVSS